MGSFVSRRSGRSPSNCGARHTTCASRPIGEGSSLATVGPSRQPAPLTVATPASDHWILVGSMMVDLLRIHHALVEIDGA